MTKLQRYELTVYNSLKESDTGPWAMWQHAADRIEALERENATLRAERDEARKQANEEAAVYHDDLSRQHDACQYESDHHEMMARLHRQFAAAIRNMGGEG